MSNETKAAGAATTGRTKTGMSSRVRFITVTAMLSAISFVLMYFEFPIPIMPAFIKFDFSDLPALIGTFAYGPLCGVIICLIKNLLHLMDSNSMLVGELSNFILGAAFVIPAGLIYKFKKTKKSALIGGITGAVFMGVFCVFSNYFISGILSGCNAGGSNPWNVSGNPAIHEIDSAESDRIQPSVHGCKRSDLCSNYDAGLQTTLPNPEGKIQRIRTS